MAYISKAGQGKPGKKYRSAAIAGVLMTVLGWSSWVGAEEQATEVNGQITVAGSETMQPMVAKLAAEFMRLHPDVGFTIEGSGSASAIREFTLGLSLQRRGDKAREGHEGASTANLLASSRTLTDKELRAFASHHGYEPLEFPVAIDAVTIYVNAENPVQGLTLEQVDAIFGSERKRGYPEDIATWGQAGVKAAGWEKQAIRLYGRNEKSGTREFFIQTALKGGALKENIREQPGPASEILAIARDPLGIGYAGTGYQTSLVRVVPVAEQAGRPPVAPSQDTVADGTYPLGRALYLYVAKAPKERLGPAMLEFLKFVNSREGQDIVSRAGFFRLTSAMVAKNMAVLTGGSVTANLSAAKH